MIIIRCFAIIIRSKSGPGELKKIRRVGGGGGVTDPKPSLWWEKKLRQPEADSAMYSLVDRKEKLVSQVWLAFNLFKISWKPKVMTNIVPDLQPQSSDSDSDGSDVGRPC